MQLARLRSKKWAQYAGIAGVALLLGAAGGYVAFTRPAGVGPAMRGIFKAVPSVISYNQDIKTQTVFSDRLLKISGTYEVDYPRKAYAAYSTTTLVVGGQPHKFTLDNVAIGSDVYLKVDTTDPLLQKTIQRVPQWRHYTASGIPPRLTGIAIAGPIEDTLQILGDNGAYLRFMRRNGAHYTFALSGVKPTDRNGPLNALMMRVATGTVEVWIDPVHELVRQIVFSNPPFYSTSTISRVNEPLSITPPPLPQ